MTLQVCCDEDVMCSKEPKAKKKEKKKEKNFGGKGVYINTPSFFFFST